MKPSLSTLIILVLIIASMGLCWTPKGGYLGLYYSNNPLTSLIIFVKLPQLMRSSFDEGEFSGSSSVVGG